MKTVNLNWSDRSFVNEKKRGDGGQNSIQRCISVGVLAMAMAMAIVACAGVARTPVVVDAPTSAFITLGTQSGPISFGTRAQPANLLISGSQHILLDVGDGAAEQVAKVGVSLGDIQTVFISHLHLDHVGGLHGFLGRRAQAAHATPVTIYGPPGTAAVVDSILMSLKPSFDVLARPWPDIRVIEIEDGDQIVLGNIVVKAAANSHYQNKSKSFASLDYGPLSLSFRFDLPERSIVFTGDTGPSVNVERLADGADLLVSEIIDVDATLDLIKSMRPDISESELNVVASHFSLEHLPPEAAADLARRAGVAEVVFTHIGGAQSETEIEAMEARVRAAFGGEVKFAQDLDRF